MLLIIIEVADFSFHLIFKFKQYKNANIAKLYYGKTRWEKSLQKKRSSLVHKGALISPGQLLLSFGHHQSSFLGGVSFMLLQRYLSRLWIIHFVRGHLSGQMFWRAAKLNNPHCIRLQTVMTENWSRDFLALLLRKKNNEKTAVFS